MTFGHRLMRLAPNFCDQCAKYESSSCWLQKISRNRVRYNLKLKDSERLCYLMGDVHISFSVYELAYAQTFN